MELLRRNGRARPIGYRLSHPLGRRPLAAILDGEIIVQDEHGMSDFGALRHAMRDEPHRLAFFAFDLLHLDGEDLRDRTLLARKAQLQELLGPADPMRAIQFCDAIDGDGAAVFAAADRMGLEGIVSKRAASRYRSGPSATWLKTKCTTESEFIVVGMAPGDRGPPFALLAREETDGLRYVGSAFVTLAQPERDRFWTRAGELVTEKPALKDLRRQKATWVRPELRVRARHLRGGDMIRHGSLTAVL